MGNEGVSNAQSNHIVLLYAIPEKGTNEVVTAIINTGNKGTEMSTQDLAHQ
jgi:hypothetical protein